MLSAGLLGSRGRLSRVLIANPISAGRSNNTDGMLLWHDERSKLNNESQGCKRRGQVTMPAWCPCHAQAYARWAL
jgi:hypothetical protein